MLNSRFMAELREENDLGPILRENDVVNSYIKLKAIVKQEAGITTNNSNKAIISLVSDPIFQAIKKKKRNHITRSYYHLIEIQINGVTHLLQIGDIVALQCEDSTPPSDNKNCWRPFLVPWSPCQSLSI